MLANCCPLALCWSAISVLPSILWPCLVSAAGVFGAAELGAEHDMVAAVSNQRYWRLLCLVRTSWVARRRTRRLAEVTIPRSNRNLWIQVRQLAWEWKWAPRIFRFMVALSPEDFLAQCSRLAAFGRISNDSLASIVAARCSGRALTVVNELEQRLGRLFLAQLTTSLTSHLSAQPTAAQAAMQLSRLLKGRMKAREFGQQVRLLVRRACPEFFTK